jgi:hypothetical protein
MAMGFLTSGSAATSVTLKPGGWVKDFAASVAGSGPFPGLGSESWGSVNPAARMLAAVARGSEMCRIQAAALRVGFMIHRERWEVGGTCDGAGWGGGW